MPHAIRAAYIALALAVAPLNAEERPGLAYPMQEGRFDSTWDSLDQYECPEWFRDAKFGMWAIIGPQCVPLQGDWYARGMYIEGSPQYKHHVTTYGHPSKFGYKDLIPLFNPTKLDYDKLVGLYKKAGAKYAVVLAVHCDNFDLWNSHHHVWNSVNMGPKRDLVGEFRDAARKHHLRFGVTTHLARSYSWLQTSHGADKQGPMKGVPYDGADPSFYSLYHPPGRESPFYPPDPPEAWRRAWYLRVKDLIDQYQPDLVYIDGGFPFCDNDGAQGRQLAAHYYNASMSWHNGRNEAVMNIKNWTRKKVNGSFRDGTCIEDIERGRAGELRELPWQTDTCLGGWYYHEGIQYKTAGHCIRMLVDIVSKNGNLLLNVPLHPEGWIDQREVAVIEGIGKWMAVNGEGIYETRPWLTFGEGPATKAGGGHFNEEDGSFTPRDLRFTAKGDHTLFAFFMAWPDNGKLLVRSLASTAGNKGEIGKVALLGHKETLMFQHTAEGLLVTLPDKQPGEHAWCLKITGKQLRRPSRAAPGRNEEPS